MSSLWGRLLTIPFKFHLPWTPHSQSPYPFLFISENIRMYNVLILLCLLLFIVCISSLDYKPHDDIYFCLFYCHIPSIRIVLGRINICWMLNSQMGPYQMPLSNAYNLRSLRTNLSDEKQQRKSYSKESNYEGFRISNQPLKRYLKASKLWQCIPRNFS